MDLRSDHMGRILKTEPVQKIFSFLTVRMQDIFALASSTTGLQVQRLMKQKPMVLENSTPSLLWHRIFNFLSQKNGKSQAIREAAVIPPTLEVSIILLISLAVMACSHSLERIGLMHTG